MAEKDISEKLLEDYNDVFADIVNVLLFDGEEVIKPDELEQTSGLSQYKADAGRLHQQERDISKFWTRGGLRLALCGLENQTAPDSAAPSAGCALHTETAYSVCQRLSDTSV